MFKPVAGTGKGFLSMQSLAAHKGQKLWRSNGSLHTLACHPPLSPGPRASQAQARAQLLHALSLDEGGPEPEPSLSDSSSGGSFSRSPGMGPGPFSSSLGHINHLGGSLDRASRSPKEAGPLAGLNCLPEPPPPYELSCHTAEEVVAMLPDTCEDLKRGLSDQDGVNHFTQVRAASAWGPALSLGIGGLGSVLSQFPHVTLDMRERRRCISSSPPSPHGGMSGHSWFLLGLCEREGETPGGRRAGICWGHFTSGGHPRVGHVWPGHWALVLWFWVQDVGCGYQVPLSLGRCWRNASVCGCPS